MHAPGDRPPEPCLLDVRDVGRFQVHRYAALDSTNTWLKARAREFPPFAVVWTDRQTAGRGRFERRWQAQPGKDLCCSLLLPVAGVEAARRPMLALLAALAVARVLQARGAPAAIKWPNDLLVGGAKISGILCESAGTVLAPALVMGIGLNVNSTAADLAAVGQPATSLRLETGKAADLPSVLDELLAALGAAWDRFRQADGPAWLVAEVEARLAWRGARVTLRAGEAEERGTLRGLGPNGGLLLDTDGAGLQERMAGELNAVRLRESG